MTGWLCLTAVLIWALMPAGVMPARAGDGGIVFALCTGDGAVMMQVGADGTPHPVQDDRPGHGKDPCPFAAAHLFARSETAPLPAPLPQAVQTAAPPQEALLRPAVPPHLRPESRGPPDLS